MSLPDVGDNKPPSIVNNVVLPEPEAPFKITNSPS